MCEYKKIYHDGKEFACQRQAKFMCTGIDDYREGFGDLRIYGWQVCYDHKDEHIINNLHRSGSTPLAQRQWMSITCLRNCDIQETANNGTLHNYCTMCGSCDEKYAETAKKWNRYREFCLE